MKNLSDNHDILLCKAILESPRGIVIFSLDREYCYTFFTPEHQRIMKKIWDADIKIGMCMLDAIRDDEDREKAKNNFDKAFAGEYLTSREEYGDEKLYRTYWDNRYSPLYDSNNTVAGLSVFVTDVSEQVAADARLREMELKKVILRERELLLNSIGVGVYGLNKSGKCFFVNAVALKTLGYQEDEILNQDIDSLIHHTKMDGTKHLLSECIVHQSLIQEKQLELSDWFCKKNGEMLPVHIVATPLISQDELVGVVVVFSDITEEYNAKQKLMTLHKNLFVAMGYDMQHNYEVNK